MNISRRAVGLGLLGVSAAVTAGVVVTRSNPQLLAGMGIGEGVRVTGLTGGEKAGFLHNHDLAVFLRRQAGVSVSGTVAGGVEQCRDPALLGRHPAFLWPGSDILADVARHNGAAVRSASVVLKSPIVFHSWTSVAEALVASGLASVEDGVTYVDTAAFVSALAEGRSWSDLGARQIAGAPRIRSADPYTSASGMQFAALLANGLAGDVATTATLAPHQPTLVELFTRMGRKPANASQLFDEYIAAGPQSAPIAVGYESQHLEWKVSAPSPGTEARGRQPVILYPRPGIMASHAFISLNETADHLLAGLQRPEAQAIAWTEHGLRGPSGAPGARTRPNLTGQFAAAPPVLPLPEREVLLPLLDAIRGVPAEALPPASPPSAYTNEPFSPYR